jgi:hypothetical protein
MTKSHRAMDMIRRVERQEGLMKQETKTRRLLIRQV